MKERTLLRTGLIGTAVAALCCFTPVLVILLATVGLSALVGWLDFVLLPALAIFAGITIYALWKRNGRHDATAKHPDLSTVRAPRDRNHACGRMPVFL